MIAAVVPFKHLSEAKSRLSPILTPDQRSELALALLERTIAAIQQSGAVDRLALATPSVGLACRLGVEALPDRGGLNASLHGSVEWALRLNVSALLVVPADLPLLRAEDVKAIAREAHAGAGISIAPTYDGGTGALLLSPPDAIELSFGFHSFEGHTQQAERARVSVTRVTREAFRFDLDTIDDFEALRDHLPTPISRSC